MNQNIITYLNMYKDTYAKDALITQLQQAGYSDADIHEGIMQCYGEHDLAENTARPTITTTVQGKAQHKTRRKDILLGIGIAIISAIAVWLWGFISMFSIILFQVYTVALIACGVFLLWWIFRKKRWYVIFGIVIAIIAVPLLAVGGCFFIIFGGGGGLLN